MEEEEEAGSCTSNTFNFRVSSELAQAGRDETLKFFFLCVCYREPPRSTDVQLVVLVVSCDCQKEATEERF